MVVTTNGFAAAAGGEKADRGYSDAMRAEVEHRFGDNIFEQLQKRAEAAARGGNAIGAM